MNFSIVNKEIVDVDGGFEKRISIFGVCVYKFCVPYQLRDRL